MLRTWVQVFGWTSSVDSVLSGCWRSINPLTGSIVRFLVFIQNLITGFIENLLLLVLFCLIIVFFLNVSWAQHSWTLFSGVHGDYFFTNDSHPCDFFIQNGGHSGRIFILFSWFFSGNSAQQFVGDNSICFQSFKIVLWWQPVRKGPAGIQVNFNTWNLKKILVDFFLPNMTWNTGGKLYIVTKWGEICKFFHLEFFSRWKSCQKI